MGLIKTQIRHARVRAYTKGGGGEGGVFGSVRGLKTKVGLSSILYRSQANTYLSLAVAGKFSKQERVPRFPWTIILLRKS